MKWLALVLVILISCHTQMKTLEVRNKTTFTCKDALRVDLAKGWKRIDIPNWDSRKCFQKNDTLGWKITKEYSKCLIGSHPDSILSIFGKTNGFHREVTDGYVHGGIWYWCVPENINSPKEGMELFFDFRFDTLRYISYRPLEILRE
jgi:hypothetical protein